MAQVVLKIFLIYMAVMVPGITALVIGFLKDCREAKEALAKAEKETEKGQEMNKEQTVQNMKAHGLYKASHVAAFAKEKATSIEPSVAQVKYRDALYKFIIEKGVAHDGFRLGRTKQAITQNIRAFQTIIRKHGLWDEWNGREDNGQKHQ